MPEETTYQALADAYNNFSPFPLNRDSLHSFYIEGLQPESLTSLKTAIKMSVAGEKILFIGHVGCGKSTMLYKVADDLGADYHKVFISADETLNLSDIAVPDVLTMIFLKLLYSLQHAGLKGIPKSAKGLIKLLINTLSLKDFTVDAAGGFSLLEQMAFKIGTEADTRKTIRALFQKDFGTITGVMERTVQDTARLLGKDILVILDNLDLLTETSLNKLFYQTEGLQALSCRTVYAFPLASYLSSEFESIAQQYTLEFFNLTPLNNIDGKDIPASKHWLTQLVYKRIDPSLILNRALEDIIESSGGLLGDLIEFMRNACKIAVMENSSIIDRRIADKVLAHRIKTLKRFISIDEHRNLIHKIEKTRLIDQVLDKEHCDLIRTQLLLKYGGEEEKAWYRIHPCLSPRFFTEI